LFARVSIGENKFEEPYLRQTKSMVKIGKVALENAIAYIRH